MKVIIPRDGLPIKYNENGSLKSIEEFIWVESNFQIISFAIMPQLNFDYLYIHEEPSMSLTIKHANYRKMIGPDLNGANRYELVNKHELL